MTTQEKKDFVLRALDHFEVEADTKFAEARDWVESIGSEWITLSNGTCFRKSSIDAVLDDASAGYPSGGPDGCATLLVSGERFALPGCKLESITKCLGAS